MPPRESTSSRISPRSRSLAAKAKSLEGYIRTLGDAEDSPKGWVNSDYLAIDPAWYRTSGKTRVYAWNSTKAPKVALLDDNTTLPILKVEGNWIVVSLRGAAGWIYNASK